MSSFLNNFCESLVNGSNPKYTWSRSTPEQQVAAYLWQQQQQQQAIQTQQYNASMKAEIEWREKNGYYVSQIDKNFYK